MLIHQYEHSTILILHKTQLKCTKSCCLNRLFEFSIFFCDTKLSFAQKRSQTHFERHRACMVPLLSFALPDPFSAIPSAPTPIFMFCAPGPFFGGTEGVMSRFRVCAPGHIFGGTEGTGSHFRILRTRTCFVRYRGRLVPIS
jgi:hypothetical protein